MKISNSNIERIFHYADHQFYTVKVVNQLNGRIVVNNSNREFEITYLDGRTVTSVDFKANVLEQNNSNIKVKFYNETTCLIIDYIARNDVIAKQIEVISSDNAINFIDIDIFDFIDKTDIFYPKKQDDIAEMANFSGYYVEAGQPVYAKSFFLGAEFPLIENRIIETHYFSRYFLGEAVNFPKKIPSAIIGSARDNDELTIQKAFFSYIESISQQSYFRKQYNSWYDHMKEIDEKIILDSFQKIHQGFNKYGIKLDAYVVDDGWNNYASFWDFNNKFPNGLTKIKALVNSLNASLGLWIGPRGGYCVTETIMSDWLEKNKDKKLGSKNKISQDVNVGDFNYLENLRKVMLQHQKDFDISYWKIDGWLLKPDVQDQSGEYGMHTMTRVYEYLVKILTDLRDERGSRDCWINLTSYVNPSPWWLQWVNSLWIQLSQDIGFTENAGNDINRTITYRDIQYRKFIRDRHIQLPLSCLYNHDPVYATTAHSGYMDHQMYASITDFENYLRFIATRGNGFWEFHYSYTMFDDERWQANARAIKWIEKNYNTLKYSEMIGGNPELFEIYGYHCIDEVSGKAILSLRNPSNMTQFISLPNIDLSDYKTTIGQFSLVDDGIYLAPYEIVILQKK
ncbi:hypothetical protein QJU74_10735 [Pasteurella atlantica]|uniref:hypothetical protein n=1 Tax=Phocoenobacter atlanticus TaxID=3416742 RepID=UPI001BC8E84E|nr:hypothetical protein [Pasteurella atlantica]MDP8161512.1 hypothetical protein [Pasteurella atlantica]QVE21791.1 hypothetical protein KGI96_05315 [Pasteurella atlantica]